MNEVRRYKHAPRLVDLVVGQPAPMPPGEYVLASDYDALLARVQAVERERAQVARLWGHMQTLWKMFNCSEEAPYCKDPSFGNNSHFDGHWHEAREVVAQALRETGA
ncbi:MAG TPA: hypothetical protein PKA61_07525 [Nitrospira sp.]|nr:hypothetical protein [Nitrospira sp.]